MQGVSLLKSASLDITAVRDLGFILVNAFVLLPLSPLRLLIFWINV